jgi:hypothetical protein
MDLVPMHLYPGWSLDPEPYLPAFDSEDHHADIRTDGDAFSPTSR